ncbi:MAG: helix-turn-helix domain-containing protein [Deltaproteobacteria bacterium]|nr:helix-turn-helix domain-containing protein [Deltaproteobacteria bacterium]
MIVLTPQEIARRLKKSVRWVYTHARELGAAKIGGSWIFTQEGLDDAIQRGQEMAWDAHASRQKASSLISNQKGCCRLGKREAKRIAVWREKAAQRHGLDDLLY